MKDEKDGLKLLDDLEELNGLPLEKKGTEIKKSLNIDKALLSRVEGISGPYVLIEGDRDQAIRLAAYIYLEKSTVYSSVYQQKEYEGSPTVISHIKKNNKFLKKAPKGKKIYLELFHYKFKKNEKKQLSYCKYIDQKTGRYSEPSFNIEESRGDFVFDDYYKDKEDKPADVKGKPIQKIIYQNHFRYRDWKYTDPKTLITLEIMDEGNIGAMTMFDMLRFKHTVFLLDFMKGIKDKDCDKLLKFAKELDELRKHTPGFLIIHVDKKKEFPEDFRKLFYPIKSGKTKTVQTKIKTPIENRSERLNYKDNKKYIKILDDVFIYDEKKWPNKYPSIGWFANQVMMKLDEKKLEKMKRVKRTEKFEKEPIYRYNAIKKHLSEHPLYKEIMKRKKKTKGKK